MSFVSPKNNRLLPTALRRVVTACFARVALADIPYPPLAEFVDTARHAQLDAYAQLLLGEAMPAGYIGDCSLDEIYLRHILDSILPAIAPESRAEFPMLRPQSLKVFDLGAGAGLPSLPLAILFPHHQFYLLDSQEKRCKFAESAATRLGLKNVRVFHCVVQNFVEQYGGENKADVVIFRAFRKVLASLELALHVLRQARSNVEPETTPKVLYWRSQRVPFSVEGLSRVSDLGYNTDTFVKFASAESLLPRGLYTFSRQNAAKTGYPRSWKKITADKLIEVES